MARSTVQDTGPGLTAAEIDQIFEPFARGGGSALAGASTAPAHSGGGQREGRARTAGATAGTPGL
ncbi:HAMP domain-containing histidine kinase [Rhodoferax antarcticus]|uniref:HAMP domain-containing histidine kinase n=1 Tax=Rhodoferax antarcticus TaxID=81479 RepID=UPI0011150A8C